MRNPSDSLRSVGSRIGDSQKQADHLKKKGGLLPQVERARGPMGSGKAHIMHFKVLDSPRKVMLSLEFHPLFRQYIQGAHGFWQYSLLNIWDPLFERKTTPGNMLIALVAQQASIFEGTGATLKKPVPMLAASATPDPDWKIVAHKTAPVGNPFVASMTMMWRRVRDDERTLTPVRMAGGLNSPGTAGLQTGTWIWEIEGVQPPTSIEEFIQQGIDNDGIFSMGSDRRGAILSGVAFPAFDISTSPVITTTDSVGKMHEVEKGTASANYSGNSGIPQNCLDDTVWYGAFGGEFNAHVSTDQYWEESWGHDVDITHISFVNLWPWVLYHPDNPPIQVVINDIFPSGLGRFTFDYGATSSQQNYGLDFEQPVTVSGSQGGTLKVIWKGDSTPYFGGDNHSESGWNEIIAWYKDPKIGKNIQTQSADIRNNPIPYHGQWAGGIGHFQPPFVYIGQRSNQAPEAQIYIHLTGNGHEPSQSPTGWCYGGVSAVIPGLKKALPHIPFPYADIRAHAFTEFPYITEQRFLTSGEGVNMPADLYASGVRIYVDSEDISQYIFGAPSGVIDDKENRWDKIDISHWVRTPGDHTVTVTTDEGEADVDTRIEVY